MMPLMLFAAGLGTRMGHLTADMPKPLIKVAGKPLIDHALDLAFKAKTTPKVVNVHYKATMLRTHLAGCDVLISDETAMLLETGGGLRHALPLLGTGPVITMNTDAVWGGPNPLPQIMADWQPQMQALLMMVEKENAVGHAGRGDFTLNDTGQLCRGADLIYTGVQIIRPEILHKIDQNRFSMNIIWDMIAENGGLYGTVYTGQWCDVGQPGSIPLAAALL